MAPPRSRPAWEWNRGGSVSVRRPKHVFPEYETGSARGKLGPRWKVRARYKLSGEKRRTQRSLLPAAKKVIASQLQIRKRLKHRICANRAELVANRRKRTDLSRIRRGEAINFVPHGPRRRARLSEGEFLCFADKNRQFLALDTSIFKKQSRKLCNIEVVPVEDVFY